MSRRRELPADPLASSTTDSYHDRHGDSQGRGYFGLDERPKADRPLTAMQALMEAAPFEEPPISIEELADLREILCDALDKLSDQSRWIVEACVSGRTSLRELGREIALSKTHVARLRDAAFAELREILADNPTVLEHIARNHSSEDDE